MSNLVYIHPRHLNRRWQLKLGFAGNEWHNVCFYITLPFLGMLEWYYKGNDCSGWPTLSKYEDHYEFYSPAFFDRDDAWIALVPSEAITRWCTECDTPLPLTFKEIVDYACQMHEVKKEDYGGF